MRCIEYIVHTPKNRGLVFDQIWGCHSPPPGFDQICSAPSQIIYLPASNDFCMVPVLILTGHNLSQAMWMIDHPQRLEWVSSVWDESEYGAGADPGFKAIDE